MERSEVAVVIPALNEAATIGRIAQAVANQCPVIVVDDGSTDGTADRARDAGAEVVRHDGNQGYEAALESGFKAAQALGYRAVITMDADGEHGPETLESFLALVADQHVPLVIGIRSRRQRLAEHLVGWFVKLRYGIHDVFCGMKGYHIELYAANEGFDHVGSVGTELALTSIRRGTPFRELPVRGHPRRERPRFGSGIRSNYLLFKAILQVLQIDPYADQRAANRG